VEVSQVVAGVLAEPPQPFTVLVTGDPRYFEALFRRFSAANSPVILPKPIWGSTILDVLRGSAADLP
jgi:hypothetical protein